MRDGSSQAKVMLARVAIAIIRLPSGGCPIRLRRRRRTYHTKIVAGSKPWWPIHRSAWKWNSANFAITEFSEVHLTRDVAKRLSASAGWSGSLLLSGCWDSAYVLQLAALHFAPTAHKRLCFVDERQQFFQWWVGSVRASPSEAGFRGFTRLGGEPVPRRPPSGIHSVRASRHQEVGVEALQLLTYLGKSAGGHICLRTEPTYSPLQHVAVSAVALFIGDQDTYVAFSHPNLSVRSSCYERRTSRLSHYRIHLQPP